MSEILLDKKEGLRIAITILNKDKALGDYGFTALKEAELILKNILETLEVEKQMLASSEKVEPKSKPKRKKPNKKAVEAEMAYFNQILDGMNESDKQGLTILDLEKKENNNAPDQQRKKQKKQSSVGKNAQNRNET